VQKPVSSCNIATQVHMGPGVNLIGQGKFGTILSCSVAGDCILVDHSSTTGGNEFYHSVLPNSKIENFTIQGNGAAGQNVFDFKDAQGWRFTASLPMAHQLAGRHAF